MVNIKHTGGNIKFVYTKEDDDRIESEDTPYTKEFKEALRKHRGERVINNVSEISRKQTYTTYTKSKYSYAIFYWIIGLIVIGFVLWKFLFK
ncbi:TPA: hypothetical protein HA295_04145 [Candidatus Woesearchaeota archaeon]|nr:hypothetical protein [Candidatus Woesearchaeota archaeon]